jgi:nucleotide-binding universal stress UspA family protein
MELSRPSFLHEGFRVNVLICVDHSPASRKAVQFVAGLLGKTAVPDLSITLFHVTELLPEYVLSEQPAPGMTQRSLAESWAERAIAEGRKLLDENHQELLFAGVAASRIQLKLSTTNCLPESKKVAAALAIIDEVKDGPYTVVCLGRRGASQLASSFIGGIAEKVIRECQGKTVWLVD